MTCIFTTGSIHLASFRMGGLMFYGGFKGSRSSRGIRCNDDNRPVCFTISFNMNMHVFQCDAQSNSNGFVVPNCKLNVGKIVKAVRSTRFCPSNLPTI